MVRIEGLAHGLVEPVPRQLPVTDDQTVDGEVEMRLMRVILGGEFS